MATKVNGSDVHMATAAVGTEEGGGRRREGRGGRGVFWMLTHSVAAWKVF